MTVDYAGVASRTNNIQKKNCRLRQNSWSCAANKIDKEYMIMTRQEMIDTISAVKSPYKERKTLFDIAGELGIKFKKTQCSKCCNDLYNIIREELGMIGSAADMSDFNDVQSGDYKYIYIGGQSVGWMGNVMNQDTPIEVIEDFVKRTGDRYYKKVKVETPEDINNDN